MLGATLEKEGRCLFRVWAPLATRVEVHLVAPEERLVPMERDARGYYHALVPDVRPGALYRYRLDGEREHPDPASRCQPQGVHGPSQVSGVDFAWSKEDSEWPGLTLSQAIFYELHVGTFTPAGTFDGVIGQLDALCDLGVTALELMPVAQFPGARGWGYDGVHLFAVQDSYGGPLGLKRLVDACHKRGLAVFLDVVQNHLGPEGNYLWDYGPYFTDRYHTPWGLAINLDGAYSDEVRQFLCENARYWIREFHVDGLRFDAVHALFDSSARPFLADLSLAVHEEAARLRRPAYAIAESDQNDARLLRPPTLGGYGFDAQWNDDLHHALHAYLTGEQSGYYEDFGRFDQLVKALREGFVYTGEYSPSRKRSHGSSARLLPRSGLLVCSQNHDQVGNRMLGERLTQLVSEEGLKLAAAVVLLGPYVPLLFMGEEYGETAPFQYFTSHSDPALIESVRSGRRREFQAFAWQGEAPDPQEEATFLRSRLNHALRTSGHHARLLSFYKELIRLRRTLPALTSRRLEDTEVLGLEEEVILLRRSRGEERAFMMFHFGKGERTVPHRLQKGSWHKLLDSSDASRLPPHLESDGEGEVTLLLPPLSVVLYGMGGTGERETQRP